MKQTLDYAAPEKKPYAPLWPAFLVALAGCPVAAIVTSLLGCQLLRLLFSSSLSARDLKFSVLWGVVIGGIGGLVVAAVAFCLRSRAMKISIVGLLVVAAISGGLLCFLMYVVGQCLRY